MSEGAPPIRPPEVPKPLPTPEVVPTAPPTRVYLGGQDFDVKNLAQTRADLPERAYMAPTPGFTHAVKGPEGEPYDHTKHTAEQIVKRLGDGGDLEVLFTQMAVSYGPDIVQEVVASGKLDGRTLKLIYHETPGLAGSGLRYALDQARRTGGLLRGFAFMEQELYCPTPEAFRASPNVNISVPKEANLPEGTEIVQTTEQERADRRQHFRDSLERVMPDTEARELLEANLELVDSQLVALAEDSVMDSGKRDAKIQELLVERGKILEPYHANLIPSEPNIEQKIQTLYEQFGLPASGEAGNMVAYAAALLPMGVDYALELQRGHDDAFKALLEAAAKHSVDVSVTLATGSNAKLLTPEELRPAREFFVRHGIEPTVKLLQDVGSSGHILDKGKTFRDLFDIPGEPQAQKPPTQKTPLR